MNKLIKKEISEVKALLNSLPTVLFSLFILALFLMNLLANKSLNVPFKWLALDGGIVISWFLFLTMDVITRYFGPKAATTISVIATLINLALCFIMYVGSIIPGVWAASFSEGSEEVINTALDKTFGGTWYIIFGSSIAFIASATVNNFTNHFINKLFGKENEGFAAFATASYISSLVGQFVDNLVFSLIVSHVFFGWSLLQCVMSAVTGMVVELLCEVVFSVFGFKLYKNWKSKNIGIEYFKLIKEEKQ
jgi:uncharacterized PurR-regulated membrane protein YhhQ (DUF165 family)